MEVLIIVEEHKTISDRFILCPNPANNQVAKSQVCKVVQGEYIVTIINLNGES